MGSHSPAPPRSRHGGDLEAAQSRRTTAGAITPPTQKRPEKCPGQRSPISHCTEATGGPQRRAQRLHWQPATPPGVSQYSPSCRHNHQCTGSWGHHGHGSLYAGADKRKPPLVLQQQGSPPAQTQASFSSQPSTPDGKQRTGCVKKGSPFLESAHPLTPMCD